MNITLAFQDLDDLIVRHTPAPAQSALRNKLHLLRDQVEAYIAEKEKVSALLAELQPKHAALKKAHSKLKAEYQKPTPYQPGRGF